MSDIITIIQTVGFPIACVIALAVFVAKMISDNRKDNENRDSRFLAELEKRDTMHREEIKELTSAINNNTTVIAKVLERVKDDV